MNWSDYLGSDGDINDQWKRVTVRIGNEKAYVARWSISTNGEATFAPGAAPNFLRKLVGKKSLVMQTTPYNSNPVTAVFDIRGLQPALRELADTCHWKIESP